MPKYLYTCVSLLFLAILAACERRVDTNTEQQPPTPSISEKNKQSVSTQSNPIRNVYFGDLHIHSSFSFDAFIEGNSANDPNAAYRFARGGTITLANGEKKKLPMPLDFAAVTDHAEWLADYSLCTDEQSPVYQSDYCVKSRASDLSAFKELLDGCLFDPCQRVAAIKSSDADIVAATKKPWQEIIQAAEKHNSPGRFTTFIAFEFTPMLPDTGMLHRNVIFRNRHVPALVQSMYELETAENLWLWLDKSCTKPCEALAIPHNTNFSWGIAFRPMNTDGTEFTPEILARRTRLEPIVEIHQHKGNSECYPGMGNSDEDCLFEPHFPACSEEQQTQCVKPGSMVREGLKNGLSIQKQFNINPFQYGIIGSTDGHNSIPGATVESEFSGHDSYVDDSPAKRIDKEALNSKFPPPLTNGGGLAGVWAEENTRNSLFEALQRKEVFGTSGTRIKIRFFAGDSFDEGTLNDHEWVSKAYKSAVSMGGRLPSTNLKQHTFIVHAMKDPDATNLDRIQIIKGWLAGDETKETVFDVVCADGRQVDAASHRCPSTDAMVDLSNCSVEANKGAAELKTLWSDPAFDPSQPAFYYVRVLENPSCRWSSFDAIRLKQEPVDYLPATIQERAWSSPIWYSPE